MKICMRALPDDAATWRTWVLSGIVIKFGCDMPCGLGLCGKWDVCKMTCQIA